MYPNLRAEMARKNVTVRELADMIGVTRTQLYPKVTNKAKRFADLPFSWAVRIKEALDVDMPLEELFRREK